MCDRVESSGCCFTVFAGSNARKFDAVFEGYAQYFLFWYPV
jgi:hypothetical protein